LPTVWIRMMYLCYRRLNRHVSSAIRSFCRPRTYDVAAHQRVTSGSFIRSIHAYGSSAMSSSCYDTLTQTCSAERKRDGEKYSGSLDARYFLDAGVLHRLYAAWTRSLTLPHGGYEYHDYVLHSWEFTKNLLGGGTERHMTLSLLRHSTCFLIPLSYLLCRHPRFSCSAETDLQGQLRRARSADDEQSTENRYPKPVSYDVRLCSPHHRRSGPAGQVTTVELGPIGTPLTPNIAASGVVLHFPFSVASTGERPCRA